MLEATSYMTVFMRRAELHSLEDEFPLATSLSMVARGPIWAHFRGHCGALRR